MYKADDRTRTNNLLITNQLINTYADVAQFIKINERSELVAGRAADYKSADKIHTPMWLNWQSS